MIYNKILRVICAFIILLAGCTSRNAQNNKKTPAQEDIFMSGTGSSELIEVFNSVEDRVKSSDAIVYAELTDFEMTPEKGSGFVHTIETIHIIETLYGDLEPDSEITVDVYGGYVLIKDFLDAFETEMERTGFREGWFGKLSDQELGTKYFAEVPEGYYYPEIGERAVYCVKHLSNPDEGYYIAGDWQGKYREMKEGLLVWPNINNSLIDPEKKFAPRSIYYDELKEQILEAAGKQ